MHHRRWYIAWHLNNIPYRFAVFLHRRNCFSKEEYRALGSCFSGTYILNTATPLTMVLSETNTSTGITTRYWHGLDTLAQSDGTTTEYVMYDGLGSVRQLVGESGSVGLAQTFDPYGNGFAKAGSASSSFGYSGEQTDSNGFVFLRARYYQPGMGRFTQMDPSRQEKNVYQYVDSNPIMFVDPSGLLQLQGWGKDDARNLTYWIVDTMKTNAQSTNVAEIRDLNNRANAAWVLVPVAGWLGQDCYGKELAKAGAELKQKAADKFKELVSMGHIWDFKIPIRQILGDDIIMCDTRECRWYSYENMANIHFGYVGAAAGFSIIELHYGAGNAQGIDNPGSQEGSLFGDEPEDAVAIDVGFTLFVGVRPASLTIRDFQQVLRNRKTGLKQGIAQPVPLESRYPRTGNGPQYPVDHFNDGKSQ